MTKGADAAIEAMQQGAYDYLFKPLDLHQLRRIVGEALEGARRMRVPAVLAETAPDPDVEGAIIGSCPAMREVYKAIGRVAAQDVPVLNGGRDGVPFPPGPDVGQDRAGRHPAVPETNGGSRRQTAELLGISTRTL